MSTSPASTGPAGAHFEGQVGAHYLLSMLIDSEPRGLPGVTIDRVEFQKRAEGHRLDDIVVRAHDDQGRTQLLEIQAKRHVSFARSDPVFQKVVGQVAEASDNHQLAVAVSRGSLNVTGHYQNVLTWAREVDSPQTLMDRLNRPGYANQPMRNFVNTFKKNLSAARAPDDDTTVWRLLSRFQILLFDYGAPGSLAEAWDRERSSQALDDNDQPRAGAFHRLLIELAIETEAAGGDLTSDRLIDRLNEGSFRLAGRRRYREARRTLAEFSRHALEDINDRVGGVTLARLDRISEVREALGQCRYVEIRGDPGVGKSALLKQFAKQLSTEASIIVLSPGRTLTGGWIGMKAALGFDGTARDLLVDMAGSGSTTIFLDGLEFFSPEEQSTIRDLVREAAEIGSMTLVATARLDFGRGDEPNWLPSDALERFGRSTVLIDELNETDVAELAAAAPELRSILAESHPARMVARNLFRLSRLAATADSKSPRTEIDMAHQWWRTADGESGGRRDRARLLRDLAMQAIPGSETADAGSYPSPAVDALLRSQTLKELDFDRLTFRHDIYRDWAIANVLHEQPEILNRLTLESPAPATLVRGLELAARMSLERRDDDTEWRALLQYISDNGAHRSWRRAVLLAPVRSEIAADLLSRISNCLLGDGSRLLRELIHTVMAVDSVPAREVAAAGVDPMTIPEDLHCPGGPSWWRLIEWLLSIDTELPPATIPELAALYGAWCVLGEHRITPRLVSWFYHCLRKIESAHYPENVRLLRRPFDGTLSNDDVRLLETNVRTWFLRYCHHTPLFAAEYLRSLRARLRLSILTDSVLERPGSLARTSPDEFADFAIASLLPDPAQDRSDIFPRRRAFERQNLFMLPSPCQGPFLDLLSHATPVGLRLIDRIVDHAVSFYSNDRSHASETLTISLAHGTREFRWLESYVWVRHCPENVVTAALMALNEWAQRRIENGDSIDAVLADVLAPPSPAAAFLLIAVDLLIKHWPLSQEAAVPFASCPELLCMDRAVNRHNSETRSLYGLLARYATTPPLDQRDRLGVLLNAAARRLGPYGEHSNLGDPAFMAAHALNLIDSKNWTSVDQLNGGVRYDSPDAEKSHLDKQRHDTDLTTLIKLAVHDKIPFSCELATAATEWAKGQASTMDNDWVVVAAAALSMRHGSDDLRTRNEDWATKIFMDAARSTTAALVDDDNPVATALQGWAYLLKHRDTMNGRRAVLDVCARSDGAAIPGFRRIAGDLAAIDPRFPRAILRTAFAACIRRNPIVRDPRQPTSRHTDDTVRDQRLHCSIDAELSWMEGNGREPTWPEFPADRLRDVDIRCAARWVDEYVRSSHSWLRRLAEAYAQWTATVNGTYLDDTVRLNQGIDEWNRAYCKLLAHCMPGLEPADMDDVALNLITSLPDRSFFDAAEQFIINVDKLYFGRLGVNETQAVHARSILVARLTRSQEWCRWDVRSMQVDSNLSGTISALFLADECIRPPRCLLPSDGVDHGGPLLPTLQPMMERVGCYHLSLSLFEVNPRPEHLEYIVGSAEAWLKTQSADSTFWVDYDAGSRLCALIEVIRRQKHPLLRQGSVLRGRVDHLLAALVSAGVTQATHLEEAFSHEQDVPC